MSVLPLKPGNYRLLCFDLDGTLLTSHKEILPSSLEALDKAVKAGYIIAFATGRPPEGLLRYAECFSFSIRQCYAVCYNGSATVRLQDLSNVVAHVMDGTQVKEIGALAHVCHTAIHGYCSEKGLLLEEENPHALKEGRHSGVPHRLMDTQTLDDEVHFYKCIATGEAENLDAVSICTYNATHAECTIYALQKGVNVLLEKPMCVTIEEAEAICKAEKESGTGKTAPKKATAKKTAAKKTPAKKTNAKKAAAKKTAEAAE